MFKTTPIIGCRAIFATCQSDGCGKIGRFVAAMPSDNAVDAGEAAVLVVLYSINVHLLAL
jgi:hypothetical protein